MAKRNDKEISYGMRIEQMPENTVYLGSSREEMLDWQNNNQRWHDRKTGEEQTALSLRWIADVIDSSTWGVVKKCDEIEELKNIFLDAAKSLEGIDTNADSYERADDRHLVAKKITDSLGITSTNKRPKLSGQAALSLLYRYTIEDGLKKMDAYRKIADMHGFASDRMVREVIKEHWIKSWNEYYDHVCLVNSGIQVRRDIPRCPVIYWKTNTKQSTPDPEDYFLNIEK